MKSTDNFFSPHPSAYRASYSTQHVCLRLIEEWKTNLDYKFVESAVLMDLSKAFDCIPHDLSIVKLAAYGFEEETLLYIYSYLENRKQRVLQGSVVGPILFYLICSSTIFSFSCVMFLFIISPMIIPCQVLPRP